jgi:predicted transcriptional regulator
MTKIVTISLPDDVRDALFAEAQSQKRSRSWIVREALTRYVADRRDAAFADARDHLLRQSLRQSPAERVLEGESIWNELALGRVPSPGIAISFETLDEYETWSKRSSTRAP